MINILLDWKYNTTVLFDNESNYLQQASSIPDQVLEGSRHWLFQMQEEDAVIIEEINHGYLNDGYDEYLYEDDGKQDVAHK